MRPKSRSFSTVMAFFFFFFCCGLLEAPPLSLLAAGYSDDPPRSSSRWENASNRVATSGLLNTSCETAASNPPKRSSTLCMKPSKRLYCCCICFEHRSTTQRHTRTWWVHQIVRGEQQPATYVGDDDLEHAYDSLVLCVRAGVGFQKVLQWVTRSHFWRRRHADGRLLLLLDVIHGIVWRRGRGELLVRRIRSASTPRTRCASRSWRCLGLGLL